MGASRSARASPLSKARDKQAAAAFDRDPELPSAAAAAKLRQFASKSVRTKLPAKGVRARAL